MRKGWNLFFTASFCLIALVWLQVLAPPWLALFLILIWFRKEVWYVRASAILLLGVLWSAAAGISGVWGIGLLALLFWIEKLSERFFQDGRWRIWLAAGVISVLWSWPVGMSWSALVGIWWLVQGVVAGLIIRSFRQKSL